MVIVMSYRASGKLTCTRVKRYTSQLARVDRELNHERVTSESRARARAFCPPLLK
jgi:hypothetical protein